MPNILLKSIPLAPMFPAVGKERSVSNFSPPLLSPDKESMPDNNSFTFVVSSVSEAATALLIRLGPRSPV